MIKIRLSRGGVRNKPFYKIVAIDEKKKKTAPYLEMLGHWRPSTKDLSLDKKKVEAWVKKGAQVSPAVKKLLDQK
jgi:small subunit ribosomal protein S16